MSDKIELPFTNLDEAIDAFMKQKKNARAQPQRPEKRSRKDEIADSITEEDDSGYTLPSSVQYKPKTSSEKEFYSGHFFPDTKKDTSRESIFQVVHIYTRPNDSYSKVLADGREERKFRNANIRIICHDHSFAEHCSPAPNTKKCREV